MKDRKMFLEAKLAEIRSRGLMAYPREAPDESPGTEVMERILATSQRSLQLRHPHFPLTVEIPKVVAPRIAYLLSIGDYEHSDLEIIGETVRQGDLVLDLGVAIGLTEAKGT